MSSFDVSWLNYVTVNILTLALFGLSFLVSYYLLARDISKNRGFVASILATFASVAVVSLVSITQLAEVYHLADLLLILSSFLSLAFWAGTMGVLTWIVGHFELVNKHVDESVEGLSEAK